MTTEKAPAIYTRFYDQVLTEIEAGKVHDGINLLVGMLDTVDIQAGSLAQAQHELRGHSLARMLHEDPSIGHAVAFPVSIADRLGMIDRASAGNDVSSTGRRLFEVTRELTFARALRERKRSFENQLSRALQQGRAVCWITDAEGSSENAEASHASIVALPDAQAAFSSPSNTGRFDLILAPDLLDQCDVATLLSRLMPMRDSLSDMGKIVLAGLVPHHLGAGWRSACLNWEPHCYDEETLAQLAVDAGLNARTYRDETGCIVWVEYSSASKSSVKRETRHDR